MFNCAKNDAADCTPTKIGNKKPIVLSSQRYGKLMSNAHETDKLRAHKEAEEERKYREYLKDGSDALTVHFKGRLQRTQDEKLEEMKQHAEKKLQQVRETYDQSKENDEIVRREKIAKAQQLIERLKPGPRELHTAAMQSEVLRARNVQRNINEEFEKTIKKQECLNKIACADQTGPFVQEQQERTDEITKNTNDYKKELLQTINENSKNRDEYKKQLIKEQQAAREAMDQEIKAQIEKEKAIMEKKRAALRKNALEAMKMVEQRRLRERMTEELEDRLNCVYNVGKRQLDTLKSEKAKQIQADREKTTNANFQNAHCLEQKMQDLEADRLRRDISRMQLKFTAEEQEKIRKHKAAKQARIEAYCRELQQQKEAKRRAEEEKRFDIAQRYKNNEVNCVFTEAEKRQRMRKMQDVCATLNEQIAARARGEKEERDVDRKCKEQSAEREDQYFFEYARNLMEDAHKKERPLYPFAKVVQQYKRDRHIDCERKTPKHLVSHLSIGVRQPGDSEADSEQEKKLKAEIKFNEQKEKPSGEKSAKESILENCLKITELLTVGQTDVCEPKCSVECMQAGGPRLKANGRSGGDCVSLTSSAKLRYSMNELKKMNEFAAPSMH